MGSSFVHGPLAHPIPLHHARTYMMHTHARYTHKNIHDETNDKGRYSGSYESICSNGTNVVEKPVCVIHKENTVCVCVFYKVMCVPMQYVYVYVYHAVNSSSQTTVNAKNNTYGLTLSENPASKIMGGKSAMKKNSFCGGVLVFCICVYPSLYSVCATTQEYT